MELLLIIIGGILTTAIIFMMIDWARGRVVDDDINPFDHAGFDDRKRRNKSSDNSGD